MLRRLLLSTSARFMVLVTLAPATAATRIPPGRVGVGDSIMLSAKDELNASEVHVHAKVGRQFSEGMPVVRRLEGDGILAKRLIVHLGTNGPIDPADCDTVVSIAGARRRVFLVTIKVPRAWQDSNNHILNACAATYRNVWVIRWYAYATGHLIGSTTTATTCRTRAGGCMRRSSTPKSGGSSSAESGGSLR